MSSSERMYDVGGVMLPRPFKPRRLGHFALWHTDLDMARRLYVDVLGFRHTDTIVRDGKPVARLHLARHRPPFARRHPCLDRRGRPQGALRERRVRQPDLVPGRRARRGRPCARLFRGAAGLHQPARPRFPRQQLGGLRARSRRAPGRALLRHGADRLGPQEQAHRGLHPGRAQRLRVAATVRDDRDHDRRERAASTSTAGFGRSKNCRTTIASAASCCSGRSR